MNHADRRLLYFGPLTILIEWLGAVIGSRYDRFNLNQAISKASIGTWPLPLIFGITLTLASITFIIFCLPLKSHWKNVVKISVIGGIAFILTGWIPDKNNSLIAYVHGFFSFIAIFSYAFIAWKFRDHNSHRIGRFSQLVFWIIMSSLVATLISIFVIHKYIALIEFIIIVSAQAWVILVTHHYLSEKN